MLIALTTAFVLIAIAELGDKTQLLTLGFATKYPLWEVISAVSCATVVLMALAVLFGSVLFRFIPELYLTVTAGSFFILFGLLTLFGREEKEESVKAKGKRPFWIVFFAFFVAELGDKTQLATLALSAKYGFPFMIWLGATAAMILVNISAANAGFYLKQHISEKMIKWIGGGLFIIFGIWTLWGLF